MNGSNEDDYSSPSFAISSPKFSSRKENSMLEKACKKFPCIFDSVELWMRACCAAALPAAVCVK